MPRSRRGTSETTCFRSMPARLAAVLGREIGTGERSALDMRRREHRKYPGLRPEPALRASARDAPNAISRIKNRATSIICALCKSAGGAPAPIICACGGAFGRSYARCRWVHERLRRHRLPRRSADSLCGPAGGAPSIGITSALRLH
jgi:hypothetical protein